MPIHAWPVFVDLLAATLLVILFVFLLFTGLEIHLSQTLSSREKSLEALNAQSTDLQDRLKKASERQKYLESERNRFARGFQEVTKNFQEQEMFNKKLLSTLDQKLQEKEVLIKQIKSLETSLKTSEEKIDLQNTTIELLSQKLKHALYQRVKELEGYRSTFLSSIKKTLQGKKGFVISGDRFVFQSEILFSLGSADLQKKGKKELAHFAKIFKDLLIKIPTSFPLILRIDGHTDVLPIKEKKHFQSNLDLSFARAKAVAHFLEQEGIPQSRLVPAGFAEHYPLDTGMSPQALARNRRIEFKIDQR